MKPSSSHEGRWLARVNLNERRRSPFRLRFVQMAASALMARRVAARAASAQVMPICAACAPVDALWRPQRSFAAQAKKAGGSKKRKKAWSIKKRTGYGYSVDAALHLVQSMATARFDEVSSTLRVVPVRALLHRKTSSPAQTVELALQLGVDPRKPGQAIRGVVQLPHGTGKSVKVAVFARGAKAEEAAAAGADIVGAEDLVASIQAGEWSFDKAVATPDMMAVVGKVARILGPRGLMPNPKLGTVTQDVASAVSAAKAGQVEYRVERNGIVHAGVGKASFPRWQLRDNLRAFMLALVAAKPETMKGVYLRHASLASTQGRGVNVDMATLDPSKGLFMRESDDVVAELAAAASAGPVGQTVSEGR